MNTRADGEVVLSREEVARLPHQYPSPNIPYDFDKIREARTGRLLAWKDEVADEWIYALPPGKKHPEKESW